MPNLEKPLVPLDRPLQAEELEGLLAWVLITRPINPHLEQFQIGEFPPSVVRYQDTSKLLEANGGEQLYRRVNELCWRWVRAGFLVPYNSAQTFVLTEHGKQILTDLASEGELLAFDGLGVRLSKLRPSLDQNILSYANEGHLAFLGGLYRSSAVMLGAATEGLVNGLADQLNQRRTEFGLSKLPARATAHEALVWTTKAFGDSQTQIRNAVKDEQAKRWSAEISTLLDSLNVIRLTRNEAGHPTLATITRDQAWSFIVIFPRIAEAIASVSHALRLAD